MTTMMVMIVIIIIVVIHRGVIVGAIADVSVIFNLGIPMRTVIVESTVVTVVISVDNNAATSAPARLPRAPPGEATRDIFETFAQRAQKSQKCPRAFAPARMVVARARRSQHHHGRHHSHHRLATAAQGPPLRRDPFSPLGPRRLGRSDEIGDSCTAPPRPANASRLDARQTTPQSNANAWGHF
jgi:hypothetical protein